GGPYFAAHGVDEARLSGTDLTGKQYPHRRRGSGLGAREVALARGSHLVLRECQTPRIEIDCGAADLKYEETRRIGAQTVREDPVRLIHQQFLRLLYGSLQRVQPSADESPQVETQAPSGARCRA